MENASKRKKRAAKAQAPPKTKTGKTKAAAQPEAPEPTPATPEKPIIPADPLVEKYGEPFYLTEDGKFAGINEAYWAGLYDTENHVIHSPEENVFYTYDPATGLYSITSPGKLKQEISSRILAASRELLQPDLERRRNDKTLSNIVAQLRGTAEKRDAFSKIKEHIHLTNGVICWRGNEADLVEFSPQFYSRTRSSIAFDPNARCDQFQNELLLPAVHPEDILLLQKYTGLCLVGNNSIQRFAVLEGTSGSGKTQFANVVQELIGRENVTQLRSDKLDRSFETFRFLSRTLLVGVDVPANFLSCPGAGMLKGLVGGDWHDAEGKISNEHFPFQGTLCTIITSNSHLQVHVENDADAWKRRLLIVRFEGAPPEKPIPDFGHKLIKKEGSGILNWALCGLAMLLDDIEKIGDIALTQRQKDLLSGVMVESDSLSAFLNARVERAQGSDLTTTELVDEYAKFCSSKGWLAMPEPKASKQLEDLMRKIFGATKCHCVNRNSRDLRGFKGVKFI
jgi:phage/plasmid-associated DNA primase